MEKKLKLAKHAGWVFTVLALAVWLLVHGDYGMTCDEPVQSAYGEAVRNYIFGHESFAEFCHTPGLPENIYFYGPALDLFCATLAHVLHADIISVRHGVQGLFWVGMFYPVCALGRLLSGRLGAWFAGFALLGLPGLFGQAFNNPKDFPLACAAIWLVYACCAIAASGRMNGWQALKLGAALGFVLAMRPGAWFLGGLLALVPLVPTWRGYKICGRWQFEKTWLALRWMPGVIVVAWLIMILPWPNAWHSPLGHPLKAAGLAMRFQEVYPVLLRGTIYPSNHLPYDYLATYLLLTSPLPFFGLAVWAHVVLKRKGSHSVSKAAAALGVSFLIWFPLAAFVVLRPNIYDGMRHFLFMLPALAVLAGIGAADVAGHLRMLPAKLVLPGMTLLLLSAVPAMARLHPYENVYFNDLASPKDTLSMRYETDYWFSSYREAAEWINTAQARSTRPVRVLVAALYFYQQVFTHYTDKKTVVTCAGIGDFSNAGLPPEYDYYVATARYSQWLNFSNTPVVYRIAPGGTTLALIRGNPEH